RLCGKGLFLPAATLSKLPLEVPPPAAPDECAQLDLRPLPGLGAGDLPSVFVQAMSRWRLSPAQHPIAVNNEPAIPLLTLRPKPCSRQALHRPEGVRRLSPPRCSVWGRQRHIHRSIASGVVAHLLVVGREEADL